jgi:hypothetical protein
MIKLTENFKDGILKMISSIERKEEKVVFSFEVTKEQTEKVNAWLKKEVYPEIIEQQKKDERFRDLVYKDEDGQEYPYTGAIGGGLTYSFTNTSLGVIIKASYGDKELDLTEYDYW